MAIMIEKVQSVNRDKVYFEQPHLNKTFLDALIPYLRKYHIDVRKLKNYTDDDKAYLIERMQEQERAISACMIKR